MFDYTDKGNKAEPEGETLRTFKTCYEYNKDVRKSIIIIQIKTLEKSFAHSTVQTATENVNMLRRKRG